MRYSCVRESRDLVRRGRLRYTKAFRRRAMLLSLAIDRLDLERSKGRSLVERRRARRGEP